MSYLVTSFPHRISLTPLQFFLEASQSPTKANSPVSIGDISSAYVGNRWDVSEKLSHQSPVTGQLFSNLEVAVYAGDTKFKFQSPVAGHSHSDDFCRWWRKRPWSLVLVSISTSTPYNGSLDHCYRCLTPFFVKYCLSLETTSPDTTHDSV
jgi:hypothetical protein